MRQVPTQLRRSFSWTLAGNLIYAGCQWAVLVVFARTLPMEEVGRYGLALALSTPLLLLAGFKLRSVVATDLRGEYQFADYLGVRLAAISVALVLTPALAVALGFGGRMALLAFSVAVVKALDAIADLFHGLLQRHERQDQISINLTLNGGLTLMAMSVAVVLADDLVVALAASAAVSLLALVDAVRRAAGVSSDEHGSLWPRWQPHVVARLVRTTAPLGVAIMLSSFSLHLPRYVVAHSLGMREVAVFVALSHVAIAGGMIANALGQVATPRLARLHASGDEVGFDRLLAVLLRMGLGLGVTGLFIVLSAGQSVLALLYGAEYAQHADLLVVITIALAITYACLFFGTALSAIRAFTVQLPINVAAFCVLVLAALMLVHWYGARGVAVAMVLSAITEGALLLLAFRWCRLSARSGRMTLAEQFEAGSVETIR